MSRFAISDIHGCLKTLKMLLFSQMKFTRQDELYLLGDYINKGPDSKGVLDFISDYQQEGYNIVPIRGNHDQMLLDSRMGNITGSWGRELQKIQTLKSFGVSSPQEIDFKYIAQLGHMPLYVELEDCFLVHAGFYLGIKNPFLDTIAMMNVKTFQYDKEEMRGKKIIHGHVPQPLDDIQQMVSKNQDVLKIDGGCVYYTTENLGNLVGIDIDTRSIFVQPNVDQPYEIGIKKT